MRFQFSFILFIAFTATMQLGHAQPTPHPSSITGPASATDASVIQLEPSPQPKGDQIDHESLARAEFDLNLLAWLTRFSIFLSAGMGLYWAHRRHKYVLPYDFWGGVILSGVAVIFLQMGIQWTFLGEDATACLGADLSEKSAKVEYIEPCRVARERASDALFFQSAIGLFAKPLTVNLRPVPIPASSVSWSIYLSSIATSMLVFLTFWPMVKRATYKRNQV